ncbi:MAG: hypothetical protein K2X87_26985 [Gemmataceae bacterium]|nr:hypothetical protein [Gemmataceae bacterium]
MAGVRRRAAACGVVTAVLVAAAPGTAQPPDPLLTEVRAAWEARAAAVKSLRATWTMKETTPRGGVTALFSVKGSKGEAVPGADATHDAEASLVLDGNMTRYRLKRFIWDEPTSQFQPLESDSAFVNGRTSTLRVMGGQAMPSGTVNKATADINLDMTTWPIFAAFRGVDRDAMNREDLGTFTAARRSTLNAKPVVELVAERTETRSEQKMWVDPAADFSPVRYDQYDPGGGLIRRVTVTSRKDGSGVLIPSAWAYQAYEGGKLVRSATATVTDLVVNPPTTADDFRITFPVRAWVVDSTGDGPAEYVVRDGEVRRGVLPGERRASHEELMRTESGDLLPGGRPGFVARYRTPLVVAGVGCVAAAVALLALRRWAGGRGAGSAGPTT